MSSDSNYYKEIISKLERLNKREYSFFILLGIEICFAAGISAFTAFSFLEWIGNFSSLIRTIMFFLFLLIVIGTLTFLVIIPSLKYFHILGKPNYYETARKVGNKFSFIKDDLINAMQLVAVEKNQKFYSLSLIDAAFQNVYNKTRSINFESIVEFKKVKQTSYYLLGTFAFCAVLFLSIPGFTSASSRLLQFGKNFIPPPKFSFIVQPGDAKVTKGDNILITVKVAGPKPTEVKLGTKSSDQTDFEFQKLTADSLGNYKYEVNSVRNSFKYFATAEDVNSDEYNVEVIDRPIIKTLDLTVTSPAYSKIQPVEQKDNGNITALVGSNVDLKITSTKELNNAVIKFDDKTEIKLKVEGKSAEGNFNVRKDKNYKILITDKNKNQNQSPIIYSIKSLTDAYPTIEMISPNRDVPLANDNRLPLYLKISDDYGFTKLVLNYELYYSKYQQPWDKYKTLEIPIDKNQKEIDVSYIWNLTNLNLTTQDIVTYYLEVYDNDFISGPKSAKTASFNVRVPTLNEILSETDKTQNQSISSMQENLKEAEDLKQTLNEISQELKQNKKQISWEEKEKIESTLDKFQKLQQKVQDTKQQLEKMQQKLQDNHLLSKETMEKYMELQKLMDEFTSSELKEALDKMRDALQSMNRQFTQDQMQNFQINEEMFKKSIERTLNLLKRIQIEQKMDELVKRTEHLKNQLDSLKNETGKSDLSNQQKNEELSRKQNDVTNELNDLKNEMQKLSEKMSEFQNMPKDSLDKLIDKFNKQQNQKMSQQAKQNLQQNQKMQAMQMQSQLSSNMQQMNSQLQQMQQSMMQQNQMQTFTGMMRILDNLITLSKEQEALKDKSQQMDYNSKGFDKEAKKQFDLQQNLDQIMQQMSDLSQKTFAITPEMGKALGDARKQMGQSIEALGNRGNSMAAMNQTNAMGSLNEAATMMKNSMNAMMQGGSGQGGMMSLMQQLQQLSGQQMNLNNLTQMLQQLQQGKLTMQQQAQLQRLAQQQDIIRKSLQQLNKEAKLSGEASKIPANLEDIVKQMQEVVKDMQTQKLNDDLVQKQEHILSKMLDAQKSINDRDFEKRRESKSGKEFVEKSPPELNLRNQQNSDKLVDELNRAVQEGYSKDYEELIRKYFQELQKNSKN